MSTYGHKSDLGKLITNESLPYNTVWKEIVRFKANRRREIDFDDGDFTNEDIKLDEIYFKFAVNVTIIEDIVSFDAIIYSVFRCGKNTNGIMITTPTPNGLGLLV